MTHYYILSQLINMTTHIDHNKTAKTLPNSVPGFLAAIVD